MWIWFAEEKRRDRRIDKYLRQNNTGTPCHQSAQAMQGKAAGLNVATNIKPGEVPSIRIRGTRSGNTSNEPLYVVDGVPVVAALGVNSFL
ncbi:TonB-dependent receptor plug domain-containing protein [Chitinophaga pinensis]|uniref:TonB-dependent receptor plug domain-containing protein n=1 Tax=Chitinophaga pinensis TaxID=79329 RepID=A0A5C6LNX3_9BACT|nr:TonB-dependent receptor plug domain-containing protein [Chitinophaga pinensis]TWV92207.1 hypothetical protein FEF09_28345 [Chitinophaga pinensis]